MELREKLIKNLLNSFIKTLLESIKPFETVDDRASYLETLLEFARENYNEHDSIPDLDLPAHYFDSDGFIRKNILFRYREKAKPFEDLGLRYFFEKDESSQQKLFKHFQINEQPLTYEEFDSYYVGVYTILNTAIKNICINPKAEPSNAKALDEAGADERRYKSQSKDYTRARQMLLFYFVMQLLGKGRHNTELTELAAFGHVLFAWPVDNVKTSSVYELLKQAPALRKNKEALISELEFIKRQFERINHTDGISLVEKEINSIKRR